MTPSRPPAPTDPRRDLLLVAGAALLMRALAWLLLSRTPFFDAPVVDASQFDLWARALAEGRTFQDGPFFKPPLYPYLLSWLYRLGLGIRGVYAVQAVAGTASALLVVVVARRVLTPRGARAAGLVAALLPVLPFFEDQLLAETWTILLTLAAVAWLLDAPGRRGAALLARAGAAGLALGLAALGRPNLLPVAVGAAAWLGWVRRRDGLPWRAPAAAVLAAAALAVLPATVHNLRASGTPVLVSTNLGANLVAGNRDRADGVSAIPVGVEWDDLQLRARRAGARDAAEASRHLTGVALRWMRDNPGRALELLGRRVLALLSGWEARNNIGAAWLAREHGVWILDRWWPGTWLMLPFALAGLAAVRWDRRWTLLGLVVGLQALSVLPFFVNARFRLPLLPLLAVFAVAGAAALAESLRVGGRPRRLAVAVFLAAIVVVNVDWLGLDAERWHAEDAFNEALILLRSTDDRPADPVAAERLLQRAASLDPDFADARERHGSLLLTQAQARLGATLEAMRRGDHAAVQEQGRAVLGGLDTAEIHHREALAAFPRSVNSVANLGAVELLRGDLYAAMMAGAEAAGDTAAAARLRDTAVDHYERARGWLERAQAHDPQLPGVAQNLAHARGRLETLSRR